LKVLSKREEIVGETRTILRPEPPDQVIGASVAIGKLNGDLRFSDSAQSPDRDPADISIVGN